jgi:uncharacterized protein (UPF0210 family)
MEIEAVLIFEIMGRPPEYVKETLLKLVDTISREKGVRITSKRIEEVRAVENNLFSTFAEVELGVETLSQLMSIIFKYMPSHIEVIKPTEFRMTNFDTNALINEVARRLHYYDEIAKNIMFQNKALEIQLKNSGLKPASNEPVKKQVKKKKRI